jgi:hypothetical protein
MSSEAKDKMGIPKKDRDIQSFLFTKEKFSFRNDSIFEKENRFLFTFASQIFDD